MMMRVTNDDDESTSWWDSPLCAILVGTVLPGWCRTGAAGDRDATAWTSISQWHHTCKATPSPGSPLACAGDNRGFGHLLVTAMSHLHVLKQSKLSRGQAKSWVSTTGPAPTCSLSSPGARGEGGGHPVLAMGGTGQEQAAPGQRGISSVILRQRHRAELEPRGVCAAGSETCTAVAPAAKRPGHRGGQHHQFSTLMGCAAGPGPRLSTTARAGSDSSARSSRPGPLLWWGPPRSTEGPGGSWHCWYGAARAAAPTAAMEGCTGKSPGAGA